MVLVKPEPLRQPVTTMTKSPVFTKPRSLPALMPKLMRLSTSVGQSSARSAVRLCVRNDRYTFVEQREQPVVEMHLRCRLWISCHGDDRTRRTALGEKATGTGSSLIMKFLPYRPLVVMSTMALAMQDTAAEVAAMAIVCDVSVGRGVSRCSSSK